MKLLQPRWPPGILCPIPHLPLSQRGALACVVLPARPLREQTCVILDATDTKGVSAFSRAVLTPQPRLAGTQPGILLSPWRWLSGRPALSQSPRGTLPSLLPCEQRMSDLWRRVSVFGCSLPAHSKLSPSVFSTPVRELTCSLF